MQRHLSSLAQLDKFCFFQPPRAMDETPPTYSRQGYITLSGQSSPNGFPFYTNGSNSPRSTPTPTQTYDSAQNAFDFQSVPSYPPVPSFPSPTVQATTPRASPPVNGTKPELIAK